MGRNAAQFAETEAHEEACGTRGLPMQIESGATEVQLAVEPPAAKLVGGK